MRAKQPFIYAALLSLFAISAGVSVPATQPSDDDLAVPMPALPDEFSVLQNRNVFGTPKNHGGPQAASGPEAGVVLKGVVQAGKGCTAFVEELASKQVKQMSAGDAVARGKIKSIDLETIEYEAGGAVHRIEVGQDFNGQTPPPPPPPAPPKGQGGPPQGPGMPGQPPMGQPMPGQPEGPPGVVVNGQPAPPPPNQDGPPNQ